MLKKKHLLGGAILLSLVVAIVINVNLSVTGSQSNDLVFTNIEALAQGEGGGTDCLGSGNIDCGSGKYKYMVNR